MHWIDPNCLPETRGAVKGFIVNRHGEIDGLLLAGERSTTLLVCMPPHLAPAVEAHVQCGDTIRVRGVRPRRADIIAAIALTTASGVVIVDDGPDHENAQDLPHRHGKPQKMEAEGAVRLPLHGPKGELRGAVLDDGTIVRIGAKDAGAIGDLLRPGASVAVRGGGLPTKHGWVISAEEIGPERHAMKELATKHKEHQDKEPKHKDKLNHEKRHDERAPADGRG